MFETTRHFKRQNRLLYISQKSFINKVQGLLALPLIDNLISITFGHNFLRLFALSFSPAVRVTDLHQAERPRVAGDEHPERLQAFELPHSKQPERPLQLQQRVVDFVRTSDAQEAEKSENFEGEKVERADDDDNDGGDDEDFRMQARLRMQPAGEKNIFIHCSFAPS